MYLYTSLAFQKMAGRSNIMVFRPTLNQFKNFSKYIETIETQGAHEAGLAKIIPPEGWCPRKEDYNLNLFIPAPITQNVTGQDGIYLQSSVRRKGMRVPKFKSMAENNQYKTPPHADYEHLEKLYWQNIKCHSAIYGADVSGSLFDPDVHEFNIKNLNTILDQLEDEYEGVNTPFLYFGMWKTTFPWHTEDMDLYSINYLHFGAPKSWYSVPPKHGSQFEKICGKLFPQMSADCPAFLRHKIAVIAPDIIRQNDIPLQKITQNPGEFIITFPFGYHSGFNHGYNCAEAINFASPRWIEYGKRASQCVCSDNVQFSMDVFVKNFQPGRYELWKSGKDYAPHPEYQTSPPTRFGQNCFPDASKVSVGESVLAQHANRKYYWADVKNIYMQKYFKILYEGNNFAIKILPTDIETGDVPFEINDTVKVKCTDGVREGIIQGSEFTRVYTIKFDCGTLVSKTRSEIFAGDQVLPQAVISKLG